MGVLGHWAVGPEPSRGAGHSSSGHLGPSNMGWACRLQPGLQPQTEDGPKYSVCGVWCT